MTEVPFLLVLLVGGAAWVGIIMLNARSEQRRIARLAAWASEVGWTYVGTGSRDLLTRWRGAPFDNVGTSPGFDDVLTGTVAGYPATSLRYGYTVHAGKASTRVTFQIVAIDLPTFLPTLEAVPEGALVRAGKTLRLGGKDLQFESDEFNRRWYVTSSMPRFAHSIIHPTLMTWMLGAPQMCWRIEGSTLLTWTGGSTRVEHILPTAWHLASVARTIPRFVWLEHNHDPARSQNP